MHVRCGECGATLELAENERSARCLYCASPNVVAREGGRTTPELVLPFVLPRARAVEMARRWAKKAWLAPNAFRSAPIEEVKGIYVPAFLFSAIARTRYSAQIGENYTVRTGSGKNRRTETRTEWHALHGQVDGYVSDIVVTASRGIANDELQGIEPFDLRTLRRYSPKLVSGWAVEDPTLTPDDARGMASAEAVQETSARLLAFLPGDRQHSVQHQTIFDEVGFDLALLPIFVLPVRYAADRPVVRLLVNGSTGRVQGRAPTSAVKVAILVLSILSILALAAGLIFASTQ